MAVDEHGAIRYVTAFGETDAPEGWRVNKLKDGVLIDVQTGNVVVRGLAMPHSPRIHNGKLYLLSSATEELVTVDVRTGVAESIIKLDGFLRGLCFRGDYAFVGTSKLRKTHTFGDLPIANKRISAGVHVVNLRDCSKFGSIHYQDDLSEIYDLQVLTGARRPNTLNLPMSDQ